MTTVRNISRRHFLVAGLGAGASVWLVACDGDNVSKSGSASTSPGGGGGSATAGTTPGTLVLVTLYGGNDALDTFIPLDDPLQRQIRGEFSPAPESLLALTDGYGLHPAMTKLHDWWGRGKLAVVAGVGQPTEDRSHFHCMDVWQSGMVDHAPSTGWIGRWLDTTGADGDPRQAVSIGPSVPLALSGATRQAAAVPSASMSLPGDGGFADGYAALCRAAYPDGLTARVAATGADLLDVVAATSDLSTTGGSSKPPKGKATKQAKPGKGRGAGLADQLDLVAACRAADFPTSVYAVSQGGYDTHATEEGAHEDLLGELDTALGGFFDRLAADGTDGDVTVLVYSEFGRRVAPNASGGTDHGKAGVAFAVGPAVKGGLYGEPSPLDDLDDGDLRVTTDFRDVYATVCEGVLGAAPKDLLDGDRRNLGFV